MSNTLVSSSLFLKTLRGRFGGTIWYAGCWVLWVWCASWWHMSTTVLMWSWPILSPPACSGGTTPWPTYRSEHRALDWVAVRVCVMCMESKRVPFLIEPCYTWLIMNGGLYSQPGDKWLCFHSIHFQLRGTCQHSNVLQFWFLFITCNYIFHVHTHIFLTCVRNGYDFSQSLCGF